MDKVTEKYTTLMEQRSQIVSQIQINTQSFHNAVFSILAVYSASYFITVLSGEALTLTPVFIISQVTFALICYVMGLLFAMNNERDLIRAIDKYIEENYGIDTLFWQGELSYQHINNKSGFSALTFTAAVIVIVLVVGTLIFRFEAIAVLIRKYIVFAVVLFVEALTIMVLILRNLKYKMTGKSKIMDDCYDFLKRNDKEKK